MEIILALGQIGVKEQGIATRQITAIVRGGGERGRERVMMMTMVLVIIEIME
jgi:hypothetical protein